VTQTGINEAYGQSLGRINLCFSDKPGMTRFLDLVFVICEEIAAPPIKGLRTSISLLLATHAAAAIPNQGECVSSSTRERPSCRGLFAHETPS
jgi:hypothetical protein